MRYLLMVLISSFFVGCSSQPEPIVKTQLQVVKIVPPANLMNYPIEPIPFRGQRLKELLENVKDNYYLWSVQREQLKALIDYVEKQNAE